MCAYVQGSILISTLKKYCTSYLDKFFLPVTIFVFSKTINLNDHFLISSIHWLKQLKSGEKCEEATAAR